MCPVAQRGEPLARPPRGQETARLLRDRYCATGEPWSWTISQPPSISLSFPSPDLLPHGGRIEEGGTARAAPARTGTTARLLRDRYCATGEPWSWTISQPPSISLSLPASSLTEGG